MIIYYQHKKVGHVYVIHTSLLLLLSILKGFA